MDSMPFTLFFMVCLLGFHGTESMPHECIAPAGQWPEECADATYCFCKPEDYPSAAEIQEILKLTDIDLSKLKLPTLDNRVADNMCRYYVAKDPIYMIKDMADEIRYVVQDPNIFQYQIPIEECHQEQSLGALEDQIRCRQKTTPMKLLVLTKEKTRMELADVNKGLPTSCAPEIIEDS